MELLLVEKVGSNTKYINPAHIVHITYSGNDRKWYVDLVNGETVTFDYRHHGIHDLVAENTRNLPRGSCTPGG